MDASRIPGNREEVWHNPLQRRWLLGRNNPLDSTEFKKASGEEDNLNRSDSLAHLARTFLAHDNAIKAIQARIRKLSESSRISYSEGAETRIQVLQTKDTVDWKKFLYTANQALLRNEPSEDKRLETKELLQGYVINAEKRRKFLEKFEKDVEEDIKWDREGTEMDKDNLDRPKFLTSVRIPFFAHIEAIRASRARIRELSESSGISFSEGAETHLETLRFEDTVDHRAFKDTAEQSVRYNEPSRKERRKNKRLLQKYVINAEKRRKFLEKFERDAEDAIKWSEEDIDRKIASGGHTLGKNIPNEDAFFITNDNHFGVSAGVFDGVTGSHQGNLAAEIAKSYIQEQLKTVPDNISIEEAKERIEQIVIDADTKIRTECWKEGMLEAKTSTTATVVKIMKIDGKIIAIIANNGDSRASLLEKESETLEHLTLDNDIPDMSSDDREFLWDKQKEVARLETFKKAGSLTAFIKRSRIDMKNGLGAESARPRPVIYTKELKPGDMVVIGSDGLHDNLADPRIEEILKQSLSSQEKAEALINAAQAVSDTYDESRQGALQRAKPDDKSVVIIEIKEEDVV